LRARGHTRDHRLVRLLVAMAVALLLPSVAAAQDVARARTLFEAGLEAARAENWEEAREAFRESLEIAERPSTLVNLAGAEVETGHLVEGAETYRRFLEVATGRRERALRRGAEEALAEVEARVPHATITIEGAAGGDEVRLDGEVVSAAMLGVPVPVNPGSHLLLVLRDGEEIARRGFGARERETVDVPLAIVAPTVEDEAAPMDEVIVVPVEPPGGGVDGVAIGIGVGVGVAVVVAVVVIAVVLTMPSGGAPYQGNFGDGVVRF
jgi:hypothetical protein